MKKKMKIEDDPQGKQRERSRKWKSSSKESFLDPAGHDMTSHDMTIQTGWADADAVHRNKLQKNLKMFVEGLRHFSSRTVSNLFFHSLSRLRPFFPQAVFKRSVISRSVFKPFFIPWVNFALSVIPQSLTLQSFIEQSSTLLSFLEQSSSLQSILKQSSTPPSCFEIPYDCLQLDT